MFKCSCLLVVHHKFCHHVRISYSYLFIINRNLNRSCIQKYLTSSFEQVSVLGLVFGASD
jgi:hypothetical protein